MKKQKTQSKLIVALTAVVILLVALSATLTFAYFTAKSSQTSSEMTFGTLNLGGSGLVLSSSETHVTTEQSGAITKIVPGCTIKLAGSISVNTNIDTLLRTQMVVTVKQFRDANGAEFTYDNDTAAIADGCKESSTAGTAEKIGGKYFKETTTSAVFTPNSDLYAEGTKAQIIFNLINAQILAKTPQVGEPAAALGAWVDQGGWRYFNKVVNGAGSAVTILDFSTNTSITLDANKFGNDWQGAIVSVTFKTEAIQADHLTNGSSANIVITTGNAANNVKPLSSVKVGDANAVNTDAAMIEAIAGATAWNANANGIVSNS